MTLSNEKIWRSAEHALKRTKSYQNYRGFGQEENYELIYVLSKSRYPNPKEVIAVAWCDEDVIQFCPFTDGSEIDLWDFNFDGDLFERLESGYEIVNMSMNSHLNAWYTIGAWHKGDIKHEEGMQKYLGYCKRNGITKEKLEKEMGYPGMDVITLYAPKTERTNNHKDFER